MTREVQVEERTGALDGIDREHGNRALGSIKWAFFGELLSRAFAPLVLVLLARYLAPAEFGTVAAAMLVTSFAQVLWDAGLARALVQLPDRPHSAANVIFWTNLAVALVAWLTVAILAHPIAGLLGAPAAAALLPVLSFQMVIGALGSSQQALCIREFNFRRLFGVRLANALVPGAVSLPLAAMGAGSWSLVWGTLSAQAVSVALLWRLSSWRPSLTYDRALACRLFGFGRWIVLEGIGVWLITSGDTLVVSRFMGAHDLGVYRTAAMLVTVVFATSMTPLASVAYSLFSRLQSEPERLKNAFLQMNRVTVVVAVALAVGLALTGPTLAAVFFGENWFGLGWAVCFLALAQGVGWLVGMNAELYRALGRPDYNTKLMYGQLTFYLPMYVWAAMHGIAAFCVMRLLVAVLATPLHLYLAKRLIGMGPTVLWRSARLALFAGALMAAGVLAVRAALPDQPTVVVLGVQIACGALVYFTVVHMSDRSFLRALRSVRQKEGVH